jgi:hypothetical protein
MPHGIARGANAVPIVAVLVALTLLVACDSTLVAQTPMPPPGVKPVVKFLKPINGASFALNDAVSIDATAEDDSGIIRVDFLVNGSISDSQSLFVASRRFEYQNTWRPRGVGQTQLTIVAYNVNNQASVPLSVGVIVTGPAPTITGVIGTPTETPFIILVTSTPAPTHQVVTPIVTIVTTTPLPTLTRTPTSIPPQVIIVTATVTQTLALTATRTSVQPAAPTGTQEPH